MYSGMPTYARKNLPISSYIALSRCACSLTQKDTLTCFGFKAKITPHSCSACGHSPPIRDINYKPKKYKKGSTSYRCTMVYNVLPILVQRVATAMAGARYGQLEGPSSAASISWMFPFWFDATVEKVPRGTRRKLAYSWHAAVDGPKFLEARHVAHATDRGCPVGRCHALDGRQVAKKGPRVTQLVLLLKLGYL